MRTFFCWRVYSRKLMSWNVSKPAHFQETKVKRKLRVPLSDRRSAGWADASIKVSWLSFSSAGCGTEMTKQTVTAMAGDPNSSTNKKKKKQTKNKSWWKLFLDLIHNASKDSKR